jgi:RNA-binding protein YlmH
MDEHAEKNLKRFEELAERARRSCVYTYSSFHFTETASLAYRVASENEVTMWGGTDNSERVVVRFGDPKELGYEEDFPIRIVCVKPKQEKFAGDMTHRDFLGAVLNLGIERDVVGDILISEHTAYLFVLEELTDFVCLELERVRRTAVKCESVKEIPAGLLPKLAEETVTVASPRLDAVLAKLYHLSRGDAKSLFEAEKVTVNGRICTNPETVLKPNSKVSIRGFGKFEYRGEEHATRQGKTGITIWRYV